MADKSFSPKEALRVLALYLGRRPDLSEESLTDLLREVEETEEELSSPEWREALAASSPAEREPVVSALACFLKDNFRVN